MSKKISRKKQIKKILEHFDFSKVHRVMTLLNWKWLDIGTPDIKKLKDTAKDLLERADSVISTGGFKASIDDDNCLQLEFVISDFCGYDYFDDDTIFKR